MAGRAILLAVALVAAAAATGTVPLARLTVLSAPDYLRFDASATAVSVDDVPRVAANMLGLRTIQMPSWTAVSSQSPFKQPRAVVVLGIDGCMQDIAVNKAKPTFGLSHEDGAVQSLEAAVDFTSFAGAIVDATHDDSSVYAVSANAALARQAMPTAASAARAVSWNALRKTMASADGAVAVDAKDTAAFIASGALGETVRLEAQTVTVTRPGAAAVAFDLEDETHLAFFAELAAAAHVLQTAKTNTELPTAISFALSALRPIMAAAGKDAEQCKAAGHMLSVFAEKLAELAEAAFEGDVVVLMATVQTSEATASTPMRARRNAAEQIRNRRGAGAKAPPPNDFKPSDPAFVEHCAEYNYYCTRDPSGNLWDPKTGCSTNCTESSTQHCPCVSDTCSKDDDSVNPVMSTCRTCIDGYTLYGNHCYIYSDFPVAFNIMLWLGIAAILSIIAICYSLGGMDPGRNSIIYRMTSQRIKTQ